MFKFVAKVGNSALSREYMLSQLEARLLPLILNKPPDEKGVRGTKIFLEIAKSFKDIEHLGLKDGLDSIKTSLTRLLGGLEELPFASKDRLSELRSGMALDYLKILRYVGLNKDAITSDALNMRFDTIEKLRKVHINPYKSNQQQCTRKSFNFAFVAFIERMVYGDALDAAAHLDNFLTSPEYRLTKPSEQIDIQNNILDSLSDHSRHLQADKFFKVWFALADSSVIKPDIFRRFTETLEKRSCDLIDSMNLQDKKMLTADEADLIRLGIKMLSACVQKKLYYEPWVQELLVNGAYSILKTSSKTAQYSKTQMDVYKKTLLKVPEDRRIPFLVVQLALYVEDHPYKNGALDSHFDRLVDSFKATQGLKDPENMRGVLQLFLSFANKESAKGNFEEAYRYISKGADLFAQLEAVPFRLLVELNANLKSICLSMNISVSEQVLEESAVPSDLVKEMKDPVGAFPCPAPMDIDSESILTKRHVTLRDSSLEPDQPRLPRIKKKTRPVVPIVEPSASEGTPYTETLPGDVAKSEVSISFRNMKQRQLREFIQNEPYFVRFEEGGRHNEIAVLQNPVGDGFFRIPMPNKHEQPIVSIGVVKQIYKQVRAIQNMVNFT